MSSFRENNILIPEFQQCKIFTNVKEMWILIKKLNVYFSDVYFLLFYNKQLVTSYFLPQQWTLFFSCTRFDFSLKQKAHNGHSPTKGGTASPPPKSVWDTYWNWANINRSVFPPTSGSMFDYAVLLNLMCKMIIVLTLNRKKTSQQKVKIMSLFSILFCLYQAIKNIFSFLLRISHIVISQNLKYVFIHK